MTLLIEMIAKEGFIRLRPDSFETIFGTMIVDTLIR